MTNIGNKLPHPSKEDFDIVDHQASERRYDPSPAIAEGSAAVAQLHQAMVANAKRFQGVDDDKREAIVGQVLALQTFLISQGFALPTLEPLMHALHALNVREENRLDVIFCQRKRVGAPKRSLDDEHRSGALAVIAEVWLENVRGDDRTQQQKLTELARRVSGGWFGNVTASKLKGARELVSQEARDHPAVVMAEVYREHARWALGQWDHQATIEIILRVLNRKHPTI